MWNVGIISTSWIIELMTGQNHYSDPPVTTCASIKRRKFSEKWENERGMDFKDKRVKKVREDYDRILLLSVCGATTLFGIGDQQSQRECKKSFFSFTFLTEENEWKETVVSHPRASSTRSLGDRLLLTLARPDQPNPLAPVGPDGGGISTELMQPEQNS